ncbi:MAG: hypothetical protein ACI4WS_06345 [Oscillospiraceae bacterium]
MNERFWTFLFGISLIALVGCGTVTAIHFIAADSGGGFLPDTALRVMGIVECAALFLLVFSRIKQNRSK